MQAAGRARRFLVHTKQCTETPGQTVHEASWHPPVVVDDYADSGFDSCERNPLADVQETPVVFIRFQTARHT